MNIDFSIHSSSPLHFDSFIRFMSMSNNIELIVDTPLKEGHKWYFYRPSSSTTIFVISFQKPNIYQLSIDSLASAEDYRFFPYLIDSLANFLNGSIEEVTQEENIYQLLDEEWMENAIADEIARLKGSLTLFSKYYIRQSLQGAAYISLDTLKHFGVTLTSSTPRLYGYIQYMMLHYLLPTSTPEEIEQEKNDLIVEADEEYEVDIPQHLSIGRVKSWQLNGEETLQSFSQEDVSLLLSLATKYLNGEAIAGVVLNDIGTLYQEGIGVNQDAPVAIEWFKRAYHEGDTLYAPTNIGDLYRRGALKMNRSLAKALEYYLKSNDPYSFYRIGQAYEEGWIAAPNLDKAMIWYNKAAAAGHHLALKRLGK